MKPKIRFEAEAKQSSLSVRISGDYIRTDVRRSEGGVAMQLQEDTLVISGAGIDFAAIHPDHLGLIAVLAFHPVLPEDAPFELQFNHQISENFVNALVRPYILPTAEMQSQAGSGPYTPAVDSVLSYGGGFDSLAAACMFPDVPLVHETPASTETRQYVDVVNEIMPKVSASCYPVSDNLRSLYSVWGLPLWVSVYIASLVLQPRYIISGSEMTGTYLLGGQRYHPRHRNLWYRVFSGLGVQVLPTSFLSEIGNARIVHHFDRINLAAYCSVIDRQDCSTCTKCLRRRMIRGMLKDSDLRLVDEFSQNEKLDRFLTSRPLYYGDVFTHSAASQSRETWVNEKIADLVSKHGKLPFHESYYPDTFEHFAYPKHIKDQAEAVMRLVDLKPFSDSTRKAFETYSQI